MRTCNVAGSPPPSEPNLPLNDSARRHPHRSSRPHTRVRSGGMTPRRFGSARVCWRDVRILRRSGGMRARIVQATSSAQVRCRLYGVWRVARRCAHIGTVKVQPNALPELLNHFFREASIGATDAGLSAFETLFDAAYERLAHVAAYVRMSGNHVASFHVHLHERLM